MFATAERSNSGPFSSIDGFEKSLFCGISLRSVSFVSVVVAVLVFDAVVVDDGIPEFMLFIKLLKLLLNELKLLFCC